MLGILRRRRNDVGEARAERYVHRARIPFFGRDEIRDDPFDAAQLAALPRLDDGARARHVTLERVLELFDSVQARFGGLDFAGLFVHDGERARYVLLCERRLTRRVFSAPARIERRLFEDPELPSPLAVAMRRTARDDLDVFRAFARCAGLAIEPLGFGAEGVGLNAALRLARRELRGRDLDLAQLHEDRLELPARLRERRLRRQLAFARRLDLPRERRDPFLQPGDRLDEGRPLLSRARDIFRRLRRLPLERFTPRERRGVLRLARRELAAPALRLRAQLFEVELAAVELASAARSARQPTRPT